MKRQAAIVGPTPAMIRWTIVRDCGLRELQKLPEADAAARQLNGLAEWSRARTEGRIHNGICWHQNCDRPDEQVDLEQSWLGFPEPEPFVVFGSQESVLRCCQSCPANTFELDGGIAGCWGTIPFVDGGRFESGAGDEMFRLRTGLEMDVLNLPVWMESVLTDRERESLGRIFLATRPLWYGLWCASTWTETQKEWASGFFNRNSDRLPTVELCQFADAVQRARAGGMQICFHSVPPGFSDGQTWTLQSHCGRCVQVRQGRKVCGSCDEYRAPMPEQKRKVLGLRPWLRLTDLLGDATAASGVNSYRKHRQSES